MTRGIGQTTPREVEAEATATRQRLSNSLDELSRNLTAGRLVDEVLTYSRGGGGEFLRGLRKAAAANPIPTLLIGAGCAMFLTGKTGMSSVSSSFGLFNKSGHPAPRADEEGRRHTRSPGFVSSLKDKASSATVAVNESASDLGSTASDAVSRVKESVSSAGSAIGDYADRAQKRLYETAGEVRDHGASLQNTARAKVSSFIEEQPLLAAAGGLIIGAALAAFLPRTKLEDSYLGAASDALKGTVKDVASQQFQAAKSAAEEVIDKVKQAADQEGLAAAAGEAVQTIAEKASNLSQTGSQAIRNGADRVLKG